MRDVTTPRSTSPARFALGSVGWRAKRPGKFGMTVSRMGNAFLPDIFLVVDLVDGLTEASSSPGACFCIAAKIFEATATFSVSMFAAMISASSISLSCCAVSLDFNLSHAWAFPSVGMYLTSGSRYSRFSGEYHFPFVSRYRYDRAAFRSALLAVAHHSRDPCPFFVLFTGTI